MTPGSVGNVVIGRVTRPSDRLYPFSSTPCDPEAELHISRSNDGGITNEIDYIVSKLCFCCCCGGGCGDSAARA
jgi:hypothetical protein